MLGTGSSASRSSTGMCQWNPVNRPVISRIDPERLAAALQTMAGLWLAYIALVFVPDLPGGIGLVILSCSLGMAYASMPQIPMRLLLVPVAASVLFAGLVHIFVMPGLSSFAGLGSLIFAVTFAICYLFAAPKQVLGRTAGLAMFATIAAISNQQTYSFLHVADTALMIALILLLLAVSAHVPYSPQPERAFGPGACGFRRRTGDCRRIRPSVAQILSGLVWTRSSRAWRHGFRRPWTRPPRARSATGTAKTSTACSAPTAGSPKPWSPMPAAPARSTGRVGGRPASDVEPELCH